VKRQVFCLASSFFGLNNESAINTDKQQKNIILLQIGGYSDIIIELEIEAV
jgi:hypothetical protein